ncbi:hypothetical protein ACIPYS_24970 [Kitasatospora sp. NPDC089913]|uniref:hypothetical protein n=1 Tax=Streptomycetaceae TaxID=2062 RepID=UPI00087DE774|nr:hypothetical protein [Streptomyces sp. TLI_053]SDT82407.1 hypothetical protein SAMN05216371_7192 [Streptomyces sp. TLI_053]
MVAGERGDHGDRRERRGGFEEDLVKAEGRYTALEPERARLRYLLVLRAVVVGGGAVALVLGTAAAGSGPLWPVLGTAAAVALLTTATVLGRVSVAPLRSRIQVEERAVLREVDRLRETLVRVSVREQWSPHHLRHVRQRLSRFPVEAGQY